MMKNILKWIGVAVVMLLVAAYGTYRWTWRSTPATLDACHTRLLAEMPKEEIERIKGMTNMSEMILYHFGAGMAMRNEWGLWAGSPLYWHFRQMGFRNPDDMSGWILHTFWCRVHGQPFPDLKQRLAEIDHFYRVHAWPPNSVRTPDGSRIDFNCGIGRGDSTNDLPELVYLGRSRKDGSLWAYEWDKGVYAPTGALLKVLAEEAELAQKRMSNQAPEVTSGLRPSESHR